ncbi:MAG: hypothetical protein OXU30_05745 [Gammaproteobacteria bacterium]|nr:hypothetical protein [Gammaproteobacteria bacterium]
MNNLNCDHLLAMGRHIPTPFYLSLTKEQEEEEIKIESILRIVPGRRLIGLSRWRNQSVIVKLFFGPGHWKRNLLADIRGINLLRQRRIPTPEILHQTTTLDERGAVLLIDYLKQGISLQELLDNPDEQQMTLPVLKMAIDTIARCHRQGLWQDDIHLDNFMLAGESVYVLDGGAIGAVDGALQVEQALGNLASFFAQFSVDKDADIPAMLDYYQSLSKSLPDIEIENFPERVISQRKRRLDNFEKKLYRSTTANRRIQAVNRFVVYDRQIHSAELDKFIQNPEAQIQGDSIIKAGNASTVARIALGQQNYVLKRYNLKSLWHSFKYLFRQSRAHRSWRNASLLEMLGLDTPHPYLIYEERACWFLRRRAFFLCEDLNTANLLEQFEANADSLPIEQLLASFKRLFEAMITYQISHGDMKASNFVFKDSRLYILDLDAMKRHSSRKAFNKAMQKDLNRFMRNWQGSRFEEQFNSMVSEIRLSV